MYISNKPKHRYEPLFRIIKKLDKKYSDEIVKHSFSEDNALLLGVALKNKARILRIEKYLHERGQR